MYVGTSNKFFYSHLIPYLTNSRDKHSQTPWDSAKEMPVIYVFLRPLLTLITTFNVKKKRKKI